MPTVQRTNIAFTITLPLSQTSTHDPTSGNDLSNRKLSVNFVSSCQFSFLVFKDNYSLTLLLVWLQTFRVTVRGAVAGERSGVWMSANVRWGEGGRWTIYTTLTHTRELIQQSSSTTSVLYCCPETSRWWISTRITIIQIFFWHKHFALAPCTCVTRSFKFPWGGEVKHRERRWREEAFTYKINAIFTNINLSQSGREQRCERVACNWSLFY